MSSQRIAQSAYPIILAWMQQNHTHQLRIPYGELSRRLPSPWTGIDPHTMLSAPLGYIVRRCRAAGLPALSAIVVRDDATAMPGGGYYLEAHHLPASDPNAVMLWVQEVKAVWAARTRYPPSLP